MSNQDSTLEELYRQRDSIMNEIQQMREREDLLRGVVELVRRSGNYSDPRSTVAIDQAIREGAVIAAQKQALFSKHAEIQVKIRFELFDTAENREPA